MIKTAIIVTVICLAAAAVIQRAMRAMRRQIAMDATVSDDWTGAKRFGGKFEGDRPPPEEEVRRGWTPVRAPTAGALSKPGAKGAAPDLGEPLLRKYVGWCDKRCKSGWLIVLPAGGAATLWFQDRTDAENFARTWHPLAGT